MKPTQGYHFLGWYTDCSFTIEAGLGAGDRVTRLCTQNGEKSCLRHRASKVFANNSGNLSGGSIFCVNNSGNFADGSIFRAHNSEFCRRKCLLCQLQFQPFQRQLRPCRQPKPEPTTIPEQISAPAQSR